MALIDKKPKLAYAIMFIFVVGGLYAFGNDLVSALGVGVIATLIFFYLRKLR